MPAVTDWFCDYWRVRFPVLPDDATALISAHARPSEPYDLHAGVMCRDLGRAHWSALRHEVAFQIFPGWSFVVGANSRGAYVRAELSAKALDGGPLVAGARLADVLGWLDCPAPPLAAWVTLRTDATYDLAPALCPPCLWDVPIRTTSRTRTQDGAVVALSGRMHASPLGETLSIGKRGGTDYRMLRIYRKRDRLPWHVTLGDRYGLGPDAVVRVEYECGGKFTAHPPWDAALATSALTAVHWARPSLPLPAMTCQAPTLPEQLPKRDLAQLSAMLHGLARTLYAEHEARGLPPPSLARSLMMARAGQRDTPEKARADLLAELAGDTDPF